MRTKYSVPVRIVNPKLDTKTITENGVYLATDDGLNGFSSVDVNVSGGGDSSYDEAVIDEYHYRFTNDAGGVHDVYFVDDINEYWAYRSNSWSKNRVKYACGIDCDYLLIVKDKAGTSSNSAAIYAHIGTESVPNPVLDLNAGNYYRSSLASGACLPITVSTELPVLMVQYPRSASNLSQYLSQGSQVYPEKLEPTPKVERN